MSDYTDKLHRSLDALMADEPSKAPTTLTVVLVNTYDSYMALSHMGEGLPYRRRTVQIELTPEQRGQIAPKRLGTSNGHDWHEEIGGVWFEENNS